MLSPTSRGRGHCDGFDWREWLRVGDYSDHAYSIALAGGGICGGCVLQAHDQAGQVARDYVLPPVTDGPVDKPHGK